METMTMEVLQNRFTALKRSLFDRLYANLNACQKEAVYTVNNPLLVLAGAVALCTYVPVLIFLVPAVAATVQSVTIEKVFRKMLQEEEQ